MPIYNFQCRKAKLSDDSKTIAKYLHCTDPYIYPKICSDPLNKNWIDLIHSCMRTEQNIFNYQNLLLALYEDDIVGILCVIPCGSVLNFVDNLKDNIPGVFLDKLKPVIDGYFDSLISDSMSYSGYNITNLCVDEKYRNKGIGALLLSQCIDLYGSFPIHLDVIASNSAAIKLYKRYDFEILNEYYGYSGDDKKLLCYHMVRMPNKSAEEIF